MRREMIGAAARDVSVDVAHTVAGFEHLLGGVDHDRSSEVGSIPVTRRC
jgi:hypothetical protein